MHAGLRIPEVRGEICRAVALDLEHGRQSLAALARTCRLLRDPALDVLWAKLENAAPLFMLFPSDAIARMPDNIVDEEENNYPCFVSHILVVVREYFINLSLTFQECKRALVEEDWERFNFYSNRVRSLSLLGITPDTLEFEEDRVVTKCQQFIFQVIHDFQPPSLILPRLQRLVIPSHRQQIRTFLQVSLLAGPGIQTLDLSLNPMFEPPRTDVMDIIRQRCHVLRELRVTAWGGGLSLSNSLSTLISSKPTLQVLDVEHALVTLDSVIFLPSLRILKATILASSLTLPPPLIPKDTFSVLRSITLTIDPPLGLDLLENICPNSLEHISLTSYWASSALLHRYICALTKGHLLSHIELRHNIYLECGEVPPESVDSDILRDLFSLQNLECLIVRFVHFSGLDTSFLNDIGKAWPRLRVLDLLPPEDGTSNDTPFEIPLQDIMSFATDICPLLEVLGLEIVSPVVSQINPNHSPQPANPFLITLTIDIRSDDAEAPNILLEIFPSLVNYPRSLNHNWPEHAAQMELWGRKFAKMAKVMQERRSERPSILL